MKRICILSAIGLHEGAFEKVFNEKSAIVLSYEWAKNLDAVEAICILSDRPESSFSFLEKTENTSFVYKEKWTEKKLLESFFTCAEEKDAKTIIYAWADCPFLQKDLSKSLLDLHEDSLSSYCFAEAFPLGLAPEIIDIDAVSLLLGLEQLKEAESAVKNTRADKEEKIVAISRDLLFSLIKKDINAFEIETYISDTDMRPWRLAFSVDSKRNLVSTKSLWKGILDSGFRETENSVSEIGFEKILSLSTDISVLHSLPAYYSIQIASSCAGSCLFCPYPTAHFGRFRKNPQEAFYDNSAQFMEKEDFTAILDAILSFSEDALISLSLWGEALHHPELLFFIEETLKHPSLSLLIETTSYSISEDFIQSISQIIEKSPQRQTAYQAVYWILGLDARSPDLYEKLHGTGFSLEQAEKNYMLLEKAFPHSTYVQFLRIQENEAELEAFIRYWREKTDKTIIQKYNSFSGYLDEKSVLDLAPLERNPCWHLRRDMHIFLDGSVPLCHSVVPYEKTEYILGNILSDNIETIWQKKKEAYGRHLENRLQKICEKCDEYYTYNF
ncbi:MAG TPA: spiro-SPASM protein [Treponemataceae bacterium]|nr:spiro-SPASM protein [Treponemataceae bacterium]